MKLTLEQVVERMTAEWGRQAVVVPSRICGNRTVYAVTDHNGNWWPLETSRSGGRQVFEPVDRPWPQDPWSAAVAEAAGRARAQECICVICAVGRQGAGDALGVSAQHAP